MSNPLKCLLLDDEIPGLTYLKILCGQIPELEVIKAYNRTENFLSEVRGLDFDLCIMDIEMPGMNGLQVASLLGGKPVIFVTAYKEYAAEAFDLDAVDYIRKPFKKERLQEAVVKARKRIQHNPSARLFIQLNTDKGKALVFFDQLQYVKASDTDSRDKIAVLSDGTEVVFKNISFEKLLADLPPGDFVRINRKELIAVKSIKLFSADQVTTSIQVQGKNLILSLSEIYRSDFLKTVQR